MFHALLTCSDDECTAVFEAYGRLEELRALACDCGCALEIIGWPDPVEANGETRGVELIPTLY
jgi:hypothetical protein